MAAKILVVDDDPNVQRLLQYTLKQEGYEVVIASDGAEGFRLWGAEAPDLILLDVMLPKLDGYQTCAIIKRNPRFADTPVVMLSSKDGVFDRARGRMVGCQDYLTKPFTKDQLLTVVQQLAPAEPAPTGVL